MTLSILSRSSLLKRSRCGEVGMKQPPRLTSREPVGISISALGTQRETFSTVKFKLASGTELSLSNLDMLPEYKTWKEDDDVFVYVRRYDVIVVSHFEFNFLIIHVAIMLKLPERHGGSTQQDPQP
jgi:hypothetical protein